MTVGGSKVTMTTKPLTFNNQAIEMVQGSDDDSAACAMAETSSSTHTSSNAKPQRSFRPKHNTRDVEGWDQNNGCDGEARGKRAFGGYYLENEGGPCKTEDSEHIREREEVRSQGEEAGDEDNRTNENGGQRRGSSEEKGRAQEETNDRAKRREEDGETDKGNEDSETSSSTQEGGGARSSPLPGHRRRVIRLYQYDEEGQRYGHLPDATAAPEPDPAPRLKQRSLSLTRLNAIMAAASAGPLDTSETGKERPHFDMEI
ncbi:pre-mRNA-splicing factor 38B [Pungitius pungitius]|uniref:pre-mRNA-splicing factor 38B n=1 Tax=Pungitius pungitius TaxID=134920 RepID=UPI002E0F831A